MVPVFTASRALRRPNQLVVAMGVVPGVAIWPPGASCAVDTDRPAVSDVAASRQVNAESLGRRVDIGVGRLPSEGSCLVLGQPQVMAFVFYLGMGGPVRSAGG